MSNLPEVARTATITVAGVDLTVHVLDDGQRVIEAESMERLFERLERGDVPATLVEEAKAALAGVGHLMP